MVWLPMAVDCGDRLGGNMATKPAGTAGAVQSSARSSNTAAAGLVCLLVVAAGMGSLWVGLSGLLNPDHTGGLLRTVGGLAGFYVVFALTLYAAVRQK
jgi:hypothetical protein